VESDSKKNDGATPSWVEIAPPFLEYVPQIGSLRSLTLQQTHGAARVTFPVAPKWVQISSIVLWTALGLMRAAIGLWIVKSMRSVFFLPHIQLSSDQVAFLRHFETQIFIGAASEMLLCWAVAGFQFWKFRRWGRIPRMLIATPEGLVLTWLGWFRMRERAWPATEIASVELRPLKYNLPWTGKAALLLINRHKGRRLRYRLSSPDPLLPNEIAKQLASTLGCPLSRRPPLGNGDEKPRM